ncbi:hypothetical protein [Tenacibaculum retecalamus]|uniref:hypothetical protein n=1 Tax=Tenacibaculum retecalamus TaxID=3018315 RepID=UPI0023D92537|nr:hypothetical protein [Tenacibaculum retecalamus]WBX70362.1 hypothetical protein PG912_08735 [Tenacibaculum retecalamus]
MKNNETFRIEITEEGKANIFQGDFNWGEVNIPQDSWNDLITGLKGIATIPETEININSGGGTIGPGVPPPPPPPIPKPKCKGPLCPGGSTFSTLNDLREHITAPLINPGNPDFIEFNLKNKNVILIKTEITNKILK